MGAISCSVSTPVRRVVALDSTPPAGKPPPTTHTGASDRPAATSDAGTDGETTISSVFSEASGVTSRTNLSVAASARAWACAAASGVEAAPSTRARCRSPVSTTTSSLCSIARRVNASKRPKSVRTPSGAERSVVVTDAPTTPVATVPAAFIAASIALRSSSSAPVPSALPRSAAENPAASSDVASVPAAIPPPPFVNAVMKPTMSGLRTRAVLGVPVLRA